MIKNITAITINFIQYSRRSAVLCSLPEINPRIAEELRNTSRAASSETAENAAAFGRIIRAAIRISDFSVTLYIIEPEIPRTVPMPTIRAIPTG